MGLFIGPTGFYLGRAYLHNIFALNFTLYNEDVDKKSRSTFDPMKAMESGECWDGTQKRGLKVAQASGN